MNSSESPKLMWHRGEVKALSQGRTLIEFAPTEACSRCYAGKGCGAGIFSQLFSRRGAHWSVVLDFATKPGDSVAVGLAPKQLVLGAFWLYGWPLMVFVGLLSQGSYGLNLISNGWHELGVLLLAVLGAGGAIKSAEHLRSRSMNPIVKQWSIKNHTLCD